MAYIADIDAVRRQANGQNYFGESQECVSAVKHFCADPQTALWRKGGAGEEQPKSQSWYGHRHFRQQ